MLRDSSSTIVLESCRLGKFPWRCVCLHLNQHCGRLEKNNVLLSSSSWTLVHWDKGIEQTDPVVFANATKRATVAHMPYNEERKNTRTLQVYCNKQDRLRLVFEDHSNYMSKETCSVEGGIIRNPTCINTNKSQAQVQLKMTQTLRFSSTRSPSFLPSSPPSHCAFRQLSGIPGLA